MITISNHKVYLKACMPSYHVALFIYLTLPVFSNIILSIQNQIKMLFNIPVTLFLVCIVCASLLTARDCHILFVGTDHLTQFPLYPLLSDSVSLFLSLSLSVWITEREWGLLSTSACQKNKNNSSPLHGATTQHSSSHCFVTVLPSSLCYAPLFSLSPLSFPIRTSTPYALSFSTPSDLPINVT